MKALDLLRTLGWGIVDFIYLLIDTLFNILREINALDIITTISGESMFQKFYNGIMLIAITLLGLFSVWNFARKIINPEENITIEIIIKEIIKCGILVLMSTFLFVQSSNLSINLSGYTSTVFTSNNETLGNNMLNQYITYSDSYKLSDDFKGEDITKNISNKNFTNKKMYNDKFVTNDRWIMPDEKEYKYSINWILLIIVGGFFLYALFFSGMMLARRQIEFLFLFIISPIVFATSIGNKQRRSVVYEQLVSLILQGAVVMLIIGLSALLMKSIQSTTFFNNDFIKEMIIKSILFIGCGTFLLTGSQVVNKFIGSNISASTGREQLMSMIGFGQSLKTTAALAGIGASGVGLVGAGAISSLVGNLGGNNLVDKTGKVINNFGKNISNNKPINSPIGKIGNTISKFGNNVSLHTPSSIGKNLRSTGYRDIADVVSTVDPTKNIYRRFRKRDK